MNLIYHGRAPRIVCRRSERPANTIRGPSLRALQNTVSHGWRESGSKVAIRRWFWHVNMTVHTGVESDMLSCAVLQRHGTIVEQAEESSNITGSCEIWFLEECQVPPCYTSCQQQVTSRKQTNNGKRRRGENNTSQKTRWSKDEKDISGQCTLNRETHTLKVKARTGSRFNNIMEDGQVLLIRNLTFQLTLKPNSKDFARTNPSTPSFPDVGISFKLSSTTT